MTTYVIHYSDPLRDTFQIAPGGLNGPGSASPASSLRLYGRGALEWGEAVNENQLRTLENYNSATPPPFPVGGQLWFNVSLYWHDTVLDDWYVYNLETDVWELITVSGPAEPVGPAVGDYWFDGTTLFLRASQFDQLAADWLERSFSSGTVAPAAPPVWEFRVWDEFIDDWVAPIDVAALGGVLADGSVPMTGDLDLATFNIINLADPVDPQDAMTFGYAEANYLRLDTTNDPMTADLELFPNGAYPQPDSDIAATIEYVNGAAASVTGGSSVVTANGVGGAVSHKPGDIYVNTSTARIWIAVTTDTSAPTNFAGDGNDVNWKQVFPALYS
jgi:hypothetical protein